MPGPGGPRKGAGEKPKNIKSAFQAFSSYCRNESIIIITALILAAFGAIFSIMGPDQISKITDYIYDGINGGVNMEDAAADIQNQILTGKINVINIMKYLPEGTDLKAIQSGDMSEIDMDSMKELLEHVSLSEDYAEAHQNQGINFDGIKKVGIFLAGLYILSALFSFLQHFIMATITQKISRRMRGDINAKINVLPLKYFSANSFGDVLSRVTNDVDTIGQGLSNSLGQMVSSIAQLVGCIIMMFITSWQLALTTILSSVLGLVCMMLIMSRSQKYFVARQTNLGALNGYIEEMYGGHDIIRISGGEKQVKERFSVLNGKVKSANFMSQFLGGLMQPLMTFVGNLGYVAVCIVGALLCIRGNITFGVITAFLIYVRLFETPLRQIAQSMTNLQSAFAAIERVFDFLKEEELPDESHKTQSLGHVRGEVEFSHLRFAYPNAPDKEIIHDFSLHVEPGQKVAIVGPTGAGKTTLVNLLMHFFELTGGTIRIDGIDINDISRANLHDQFGMVLQDTWMFEGSVRDNLVYNCNYVTEDQMIRAAKACGIHNFIKALPHGYDTILDDNTAISAGQKQLFTIARAMIQNNPMMILDEATSSVDTRTEQLIQRAMDELTEKRTSFVIAHRLSTIRNADVILVLKDGDVVEQGDHETLMAQKGFYADLYNSQFDQREDMAS